MNAKDKNKVISFLRRASMKWKPKSDAKKAARIERGAYKCAMCLKIFRHNEIVMDHIDPVIDPRKGWTDWNDYIERMFCNERGYQALCKPCHEKKTYAENAVRDSRTH